MLTVQKEDGSIKSEDELGYRTPKDAAVQVELIHEALRSAEIEFGPDSAEAGLCLIDLADWLEQSGRIEEAKAMTKRYRTIIYKLACSVGLIDERQESRAGEA